MTEHSEEDGFVDLSSEAKGAKGHKKPTPSTETQPVELSEKMKRKSFLLADSLFAHRQALQNFIGEAPYKGNPVSTGERKKQYQELKSSHALLVNEIASNTTIGAQGELRINKKLLASFVEFSG